MRVVSVAAGFLGGFSLCAVVWIVALSFGEAQAEIDNVCRLVLPQ